MEERGVEVDNATLNRWVLKYVSLLEQELLRAQASGGPQLANGRDICEGQGRLEVLVSSRR